MYSGGTRVPTSLWLRRYPSTFPEHDRDSQFWYPGTPEYNIYLVHHIYSTKQTLSWFCFPPSRPPSFPEQANQKGHRQDSQKDRGPSQLNGPGAKAMKKTESTPINRRGQANEEARIVFVVPSLELLCSSNSTCPCFCKRCQGKLRGRNCTCARIVADRR